MGPTSKAGKQKGGGIKGEEKRGGKFTSMSLARFVEDESLRKGIKKGNWRKTGKGRQIWYPPLFSAK